MSTCIGNRALNVQTGKPLLHYHSCAAVAEKNDIPPGNVVPLWTTDYR
jgi:hypothetical protein